MKRYVIYLVVSGLTFIMGIAATLTINRAANSLVDTFYPDVELNAVKPPRLNGDCYTYTPRVMVIDEKGRRYCVGGEKVRILGCYE